MNDSHRAAGPRRRTLLAGSLAVGAGLPLTAAGSADAAADAAAAAPAGTSAAPSAARLFRHGVASGDPLDDRVVLWTRVSPTDAATPGSGVGPQVEVAWEVARDARFRRIVRRGSVVTGPEHDHTVKVDAAGLEPGTWYHYRFRALGRTSRVGRTRTAPARGAALDNLRLGFVSCANWQAGWFSAYRGLAARDDLDVIVHLGDYIYEYGRGEYGYGKDDVDIRPHVPAHEILTLRDYRRRHGQYKTDADLQDLHARYPWIVTWDDHEVADNQWSGGAANHQPATEGDWLTRRAGAHRAYDEWMPVRLSGTTVVGDGERIYRRFHFGDLASLSMLDLRSYRSEQVDLTAGDPGAVDDPDRTITGAAQGTWLLHSLDDTSVQWKLIGNPVMIAPVDFGTLPDDVATSVHDALGVVPTDGVPYNTDQWDGYTADRERVLEHLADRRTRDVVFLTGDIHSGWAADVPADASTYPAVGDSLAVEFVGASITSNNLKDITGTPPRTTSVVVETAIKAANRHIRYLDFDSHGFCVLDVTPARTQCDWFVIGDRADRDTPITWSVSWRTAAGSNTIDQAPAPVKAVRS